MGIKKEKTLQEQAMDLNKKVDRAKDVEYGALLLAGITAGAAVVASAMGGTAALVADLSIDNTSQAVYERDDFQAYARERARQLTDSFTRGEIGYTEYRAQYDAIYSQREVIRFSETAGDKKLSTTIDGYKKTKDMADTLFNKGIPTFGAGAVASMAGLAVTDAIRKKYELKLALAKKEIMGESETELAD